MKTYKSIEETIADVRQKDKRYNFIVLVVVVLMIAFIVTVVLYDQQIRKSNNIIQKNEITIDQLKTKEIENERLRRQDSIRTDSITQLVSILNKELSEIRKELAKNTTVSNDKTVVLTNVNLAQDKLNRITNNISDNTIVRYYKRLADGDGIEELIENMKNPSFRLNIFDVKEDDGRVKVNTVWYGSEVNKDEVYQLTRQLLKIGVRIKNIKEFDNPKTKTWKKAAIEIGYEATRNTSVVTRSDLTKYKSDNNNDQYNIRFYSYKPDQKKKDSITRFIKKENYKITVYPDWKEKYSFFANVPTVFYYDKNTKDVAEKLAGTLSEYIGVRFKVQLGSGYGIEQQEKKNTFIIHYTE
ncbi:MAG: hypothetical protein AAF617_12550 [Bacteroidota bacterium]